MKIVKSKTEVKFGSYFYTRILYEDGTFEWGGSKEYDDIHENKAKELEEAFWIINND